MRRAGISGRVTYNFPSKEELLRRMYKQVIDTVRRRLRARRGKICQYLRSCGGLFGTKSHVHGGEYSTDTGLFSETSFGRQKLGRWVKLANRASDEVIERVVK